MENGRRVENRGRDEQRAAPRARTVHKKSGGARRVWVYLLFIFGISAVLAACIWTAANDVLALNKPEHTAVITIGEEDSLSSVIAQLEENGLIGSKALFRLVSVFAGAKDKMAPGTYRLNADMDFFAIINGISANSDQKMTTNITIPEGFTVDKVFDLLEKSGVAGKARLQETAANHDYAFDFLEGIPLGDYKRLEGYLFPDTYEFYMGEDPLYVINKMLVNFDAKMDSAMRKQIDVTGRSMRDIIIVASMIERETDGTDRAKIASVIYNRLDKPSRETVGFLQVDATLAYVLPEGETLTRDHYKNLDSPYNTYLHKGLPPGPIANPGMESIYAAINPEKTSYYFYALGKDGLHQFNTNQPAHEAFLESQKE